MSCPATFSVPAATAGDAMMRVFASPGSLPASSGQLPLSAAGVAGASCGGPLPSSSSSPPHPADDSSKGSGSTARNAAQGGLMK